MKIYSLLNLTLILTAGITTHPCGISYPLPTGPNSRSPDAVTFSPNGSYLAVANFASDNVTMFNLVGGALSGATTYPLPSGSVNIPIQLHSLPIVNILPHVMAQAT